MKIEHSIHRRVVTAFGAFTLLLCLVYTGICVLVAYVIEDQVLDNLLADEARYIEQRFRANGEIPPPRLPYVELYSESNPPPAGVPAALPEGTTRAEWFSDGERHFHLRRLSLDSDTSPILAAEVGRLLTVSRHSGELLWLLFAALLATSALALWLAYRLSSRTVRPVIALAEEVKDRQHGDAPLSLPSSADRDEIGFLARTLERSLNQLKLALRRESEFTRDVSHELRTAITIIKNTLALSHLRNLSPQETKELRTTVEAMENTISALLALARAESIEQRPFDLRPLLENRILALHSRVPERQFQVRLEIPDSYPVAGNSHLATLLIDNLLNNAVRHASRPQLRVREDGYALVFENPIGELFDTDISLLPGEKSEQSDGMGQGLYLVKRIAGALGWHLSTKCDEELFTCAVYPAAA
ncbi:sensor histidine kinase [Microbulbifer sp.]|uniref:sensor histidine kinase n=1 Tax=Microbulbifer sp. TaxID=1908541 RepID=UPI003F2A849B